jgi:hypothetical protein
MAVLQLGVIYGIVYYTGFNYFGSAHPIAQLNFLES